MFAKMIRVLGAALLLVAPLAKSVAAEEFKADIATLPAGSLAHGVGVALAGVLSQKTQVKAIAAGYGGPQVLVPLVNQGKATFSLLNADDVGSAFRGLAPEYNQAHKNLRLISNGYVNQVSVLVRKDSPIRSMADLKGKRVTGVFSAHKTCAKLASAIIANGGIGWDEVKVVPVTSTVPAVQAVGEGRADAALCAAIDMAVIKEVNAQVPVRFLSLDDSKAATARTVQVFGPGRVAKAAGVIPTELDAADANFLEYDFYLVGHDKLPDAMIAQVLDVLWNNNKELVEYHKQFLDWTQPRMASADMTIPYHPASVAFFKAKGVWTAAMEARQQELLALAK